MRNDRLLSSYEEKERARDAQDARLLPHFEQKVFSQNGEDGIIEEIFRRIGTTNRFFVEFGIQNGTECNTRNLLVNKGWQGLWIEGSPLWAQEARDQFHGRPIQIQNAFIDRDNIVELFQKDSVSKNLDLLSIDIDGNDYWVCETLLQHYQPRLLIVEYNASFPPPSSWVMPYNESHQFDGTRHYGASLKAFCELTKKFDYELVGCDSQGVNAFFLPQNLVGADFHRGGADYFYTSPKYNGLFFGHPKGSGPWLKS